MSPTLVLVGPPGSGKTTAGKLLADRLGVEFRDTDADIVARENKQIPEIFFDHGEDYFRQSEREAVAAALAEHEGVLALGGGAILDSQTRRLLHEAPVAFLSVELAAAVDRVGLGVGRPLVSVNPRATMRALLEERRPLYEEVADVTVATSALTVDEVVSRLVTLLGGPSVVTVGGQTPYDVTIGPDATMELVDHLGEAQRAAILFSPVMEQHARAVAAFIGDTVSVEMIEVPDAEASKTVDIAAMCWDRLAQAQLGRQDVIIGVGGGAVTDLAGFVAATWLRGVAVIQLPTSLLAMVDAAVGGKTGINTSAGKNLVGAFHAPRAVLCDLSVLSSLPREDFAAGLAEVIKCGFIADPQILELLSGDLDEVWRTDSPVLAELVRRSIQVKADVVAEDFTETGARAFLNYGHTVGHGIEKVEQFTWRHGEAVAVGMVCAAAIARRAGRVDLVDRTRALLERVGLPTSYTPQSLEALYDAMQVDKKALAGSLRFVLLDDVAKPALVSDISSAQWKEAIAEVLHDDRPDLQRP